MDAGVDDIAVTGPQLTDGGVEDAAAWTSGLVRKGGPVYRQDYGADLTSRIAGLYATG
ncbi:hypothetical protein [Nonomuraea sp. MG754425]|uniref:hypothetical protein n=1 Tax=Nonomuraea sp. MG754425 TaxID=2570319 RepID=UPI001F2180D9|nr:hypothetical protein [Nonomuraea sp. MG754425]